MWTVLSVRDDLLFSFHPVATLPITAVRCCCCAAAAGALLLPWSVMVGIMLEYELRDRSREMKEIDLLHLSPE